MGGGFVPSFIYVEGTRWFEKEITNVVKFEYMKDQCVRAEEKEMYLKGSNSK